MFDNRIISSGPYIINRINTDNRIYRKNYSNVNKDKEKKHSSSNSFKKTLTDVKSYELNDSDCNPTSELESNICQKTIIIDADKDLLEPDVIANDDLTTKEKAMINTSKKIKLLNSLKR